MNAVYEEAVRQDAGDDYMAAVKSYEKALTSANNVNCYINLAFLYWEATEYGFNTARHLDSTFIQYAARRYAELLAVAKECFPEEPEVLFWERYFAWDSVGGPPFVRECKDLLSRSKSMLIPYFYLAMADGPNKYRDELDRLLSLCRQLPTFKNRYISSVIEALLLC